MEAGTVLKEALYNVIRGVLRFSIVTSGRCLNDREVDMTTEIYSTLTDLSKLLINIVCNCIIHVIQ